MSAVKRGLARRTPVQKSPRAAEEEWVEILRALADPTRLRILSALVPQPLSVSEITDVVESSQYNVSKHLRILRDHAIVKVRQDGLRRFYSIEENLLRKDGANKLALDFGCCTFRL